MHIPCALNLYVYCYNPPLGGHGLEQDVIEHHGWRPSRGSAKQMHQEKAADVPPSLWFLTLDMPIDGPPGDSTHTFSFTLHMVELRPMQRGL